MRAARRSAETAREVPWARLSPKLCAVPVAEELAMVIYFS